MKKILEKFERSMAAVAFAEAGERETALKMAGLEPADSGYLSRIANQIERTFAEVAFAEANCPEYCHTSVKQPQKKRRPVTLARFLKDVGLQDARVSYCVATI